MLFRRTRVSDQIPDILFEKVADYGQCEQFYARHKDVLHSYREYERYLAKRHKGRKFTVTGFCYPCNRSKGLRVDYLHGVHKEGILEPNWRERLVCGCGLNNRMRAAYHYFDLTVRNQNTARVYLSEQTTPFYRFLDNRLENVVGSEFLGGSVPYGCKTPGGIRNETALNLTFPDESFDAYLSFDVFEHIPQYSAALREAYRVLKAGAKLIFTVPFSANRIDNIVRARVTPDGQIEHLLPPEYHGDPVSEKGVLCYQVFGWSLLDELKAVGFRDANAYFYISSRFGYLGDVSMILMAEKN